MPENKEKDYISCPDEKGSINISEEVIAMISANAAAEVDGVSELYGSLSKDLAGMLSKKSGAKGVKILVDEDGITADVFIMVKLGYAVNEVAAAVQTRVKAAVESTTGFTVSAVNVNVCGVSLGRDK